MSTFGEDLIQSLNEALVHAPVTPREVRKQARLTQGGRPDCRPAESGPRDRSLRSSGRNRPEGGADSQ